MFDFNMIRKGLGALKSELAGLERQIEDLRRQREEVEDMPLPRGDFADLIVGAIDVAAGGFEKRLHEVVIPRIKMDRSRIAAQGHRLANELLSAGVGINVGEHYPAPSGGMGLGALWFLLGDEIRPRLRQTILDMTDYPTEVGLPLADRPAALEKLDKEIEKLEAREAKLLAEAEKAGLRVAE